MTQFRTIGKAPAPAPARNANANGDVWRVPEETPVAFVYNQRNYAVMLATPADIEDFAVGFSLTERVVEQWQEIEKIDTHQTERGIELHISISETRLARLDIRQRRRNIVGRAGCGVCGLDNTEAFFEPLPRVAEKRASISAESLEHALGQIAKLQPLNAETRTVHAAAWVEMTGQIKEVREDVGRHNALDKLLGASARSGVHLNDGFILMSSRCSYEIVEKAARMGVRAIASISAPTAFALRKAGEANLALYTRFGDHFVLISDDDR